MEFMAEFAAAHGCGVREIPKGSIARLRFPYKAGHRNPLTELLRHYGVWGLRCEAKALPDRPFSEQFWLGCLAGLIDTDGCVRELVNPRGTVHGAVEYATVSPTPARQVSDVLLRLGVANRLRVGAPRPAAQPTVINGHAIVSRLDLFHVVVSRAAALVHLARLMSLRIGYKAAKLATVAEKVAHVRHASSEMHGYDESLALDRVKSVSGAGERPVYEIETSPSGLIVVNGLVTY